MKYNLLNAPFYFSKKLGIPLHASTIMWNYFRKDLITTQQLLKATFKSNLRASRWDKHTEALLVKDGRSTVGFYSPQPGMIVREVFHEEFGRHDTLTQYRQLVGVSGREHLSLYAGTAVADENYTIHCSDDMYRVLIGSKALTEIIETWMTNEYIIPNTGKKKAQYCKKGTVTQSVGSDIVVAEITERSETGLLHYRELCTTGKDYVSICADKDGQQLHNILGDVFTDYWHDDDKHAMFRISVRDLSGHSISDLIVNNNYDIDGKLATTIVKDGDETLFSLNWTE